MCVFFGNGVFMFIELICVFVVVDVNIGIDMLFVVIFRVNIVVVKDLFC